MGKSIYQGHKLSELPEGTSFGVSFADPKVYTLISKSCKVFNGKIYCKVQYNGTELTGFNFQDGVEGGVYFFPDNTIVYPYIEPVTPEVKLEYGQLVEAAVTAKDSHYKKVRGTIEFVGNGRVSLAVTEFIDKWSTEWEDHPSVCGIIVDIENIKIYNKNN